MRGILFFCCRLRLFFCLFVIFLVFFMVMWNRVLSWEMFEWVLSILFWFLDLVTRWGDIRWLSDMGVFFLFRFFGKLWFRFWVRWVLLLFNEVLGLAGKLKRGWFLFDRLFSVGLFFGFFIFSYVFDKFWSIFSARVFCFFIWSEGRLGKVFLFMFMVFML